MTRSEREEPEVGAVAVTFSNKEGHCIDDVLTRGCLELSSSEACAIALSALADGSEQPYLQSSARSVIDSAFVFRLRRLTCDDPSCTLPPIPCSASTLHPASSCSLNLSNPSALLHCLSLRRSLRNAHDQPRHASTHALVLISTDPRTEHAHSISRVLANAYFSSGIPALRKAFASLVFEHTDDPLTLRCQPSHGNSVRSVLHSDQPRSLVAPGASSTAIGSGGETLRCLLGVHEQLFQLWQACLLGESIMAFSSCPALASSAIKACEALIWPLAPPSEVTPYAHLQDRTFTSLQVRASHHPNASANGLWVGVSNPAFFKQTASQFSNVIMLSSGDGNKRHSRSSWLRRFVAGEKRDNGHCNSSSASNGCYDCIQRDRHRSEYNFVRGADKQLLRRVRRCEDEGTACAELAKHFRHLTMDFLSPLVPFLTSVTDEDQLTEPQLLRAIDKRIQGAANDKQIRNLLEITRSNSRLLNLYERAIHSVPVPVWLADRRLAAHEKERERTNLQNVLSITDCWALHYAESASLTEQASGSHLTPQKLWTKIWDSYQMLSQCTISLLQMNESRCRVLHQMGQQAAIPSQELHKVI